MLTNSFVLIYTSVSVSEESNIKLLILLGKIGKSVQALAHFSRGMNVLNGFYGVQDLVDFSFKHFQINLNTLEEVHYNITWDFTNWRTCEGKDVFMDENVFLWMIDNNQFYLTKTNLIDAVSEFILQAHIFIDKWNSSQDQTQQVQFFNINGFDQVLHYCNNTLYSSTDCLMQDSEDLGLKMYHLLASAFAILVGCLIITMFFARHVVNSENDLWNQIKKHACDQYENLKNTYIDRLATIHGKNDIWFYNLKPQKINTKFNKYWKYIWRNSVYFALALGFFLINYLFLYKNCVVYLQLRPRILRAIINSQVLYKSLIVWTSEESVDDTPVALSLMMAESYPFPEAMTLVSGVISSLWYSEKEIRSAKYSSLLSDKFKQIFYKKTEDITGIADLGIYVAGGVLPFEAFYLDVNGRDDLVLWFDLVCEINALDGQYDLLVNLADDDTKNAISLQLQWIIIALAFFIILSLILYFVLYLPFLIEEQRRLKKMKAIAKMIPRNIFN